MSSSSDKDKPPNDDRCSSDPFTAFTRFVDDRISHMLQAVVGLPSSKEDMRTWRPWEELQHKDRHPWGWGFDEQRQGEHDHARAPNKQQAVTSRSQEEGISSSHTSHNSTPAYLPAERSRSNFEDSFERCEPTQAMARLWRFLRNSSYSPLHLEHDPAATADRIERQIPWRQAFTELMYETQRHVDYETFHTEGRSSRFCLPRDLVPLAGRRLEPGAWTSLFMMQFGHAYHSNYLYRQMMANQGSINGLFEYMRSSQAIARDIEPHSQAFSRAVREHHSELIDKKLGLIVFKDGQGTYDDYSPCLSSLDERVGFPGLPDGQEDAEEDDNPDELYDFDNEDEDEFDLDENEDDDEFDNQDDDHDEDTPETEFDMLLQLLDPEAQRRVHEATSNHRQTSADSPPAKDLSRGSTTDTVKPSIIGRLTTIERIQLPDGTVETRRVLKTRFSDGTENTEESKDVVLAKQQATVEDIEEPKSVTKTRSVQPSAKPHQEGKKRGGWFWK